jgi:hypothetical protein
MNISEQVTLLFTDDNFGNLLHVPLANETSRAGGSGIYYHFGYVGSPRSYEWIDTIQLSKTWEQLHLAYERGARQVWIANVQDIKPYVGSHESRNARVLHLLIAALGSTHESLPGHGLRHVTAHGAR